VLGAAQRNIRMRQGSLTGPAIHEASIPGAE
jgi:hypothetical protein